MNQKAESTALTVVQRAVVALGYNEETRKGLIVLADETKHITAITNQDGREQAHAALMKLKNTRIAIEKRGKTAREDATAFSKAVISEEDALINLISPEEDRLQALRDEWDDRIENERKAKVEAEEKRQREIQRRIDALRGTVNLALRAKVSTNVAYMLADIETLVIDEATFGDACQTAATAKAETIAELMRIRDEMVKREAEAEQLRKDREDLERMRAEQAERDRIAREAREAEERAAREKRDAEVKAENERLAKERAKFEAEQAAVREQQREAQAKIDAENARIAAEQAAAQEVINKANRELEARQQAERDAQAQREREAQAAEETRQREAREAAAEAERQAEAQRRANYRPTFDEIVAFVAAQFGVEPDKVRTWISERKAAKAAA